MSIRQCSLANVTVQNVGVSCNTSPSFICLVDTSKAHFLILIGKRAQFLLFSEAGWIPQKECSGTHTKARLIDNCSSMKDNDFDSFSKWSS